MTRRTAVVNDADTATSSLRLLTVIAFTWSLKMLVWLEWRCSGCVMSALQEKEKVVDSKLPFELLPAIVKLESQISFWFSLRRAPRIQAHSKWARCRLNITKSCAKCNIMGAGKFEDSENKSKWAHFIAKFAKLKKKSVAMCNVQATCCSAWLHGTDTYVQAIESSCYSGHCLPLCRAKGLLTGLWCMASRRAVAKLWLKCVCIRIA